MSEYKLTTRLFSESCSIVNGIELDLFPWLRFLPNENFRKLTHARDLLDKWIDAEYRTAKVNQWPFRPKNSACGLVCNFFLLLDLDWGGDIIAFGLDIR